MIPAGSNGLSFSLYGEFSHVCLFSGISSSPIRRFRQVLVTSISILLMPGLMALEMFNEYGGVHRVPQLTPFTFTVARL
jgi:hypothetical protein